MKFIDHKEIIAIVEAGTPVLCLDVREAYRQLSFDAGALKMPHNEIHKHAARLSPFKDMLTVVCCISEKSKRTQKAAEALQNLGFTDVRELKGGMMAGWVMKVKKNTKLPVPAAALKK